jgi:hypothetical protein
MLLPLRVASACFLLNLTREFFEVYIKDMTFSYNITKLSYTVLPLLK